MIDRQSILSVAVHGTGKNCGVSLTASVLRRFPIDSFVQEMKNELRAEGFAEMQHNLSEGEYFLRRFLIINTRLAV